MLLDQSLHLLGHSAFVQLLTVLLVLQRSNCLRLKDILYNVYMVVGLFIDSAFCTANKNNHHDLEMSILYILFMLDLK